MLLAFLVALSLWFKPASAEIPLNYGFRYCVQTGNWGKREQSGERLLMAIKDTAGDRLENGTRVTMLFVPPSDGALRV